MINIPLVIICTVLSFLIIVFIYPKVLIYLKKSFKILVLIFLILLFIVYPEFVTSAAKNSINMCLNTIFPSLFPFLVTVEILKQTNFIPFFGKILEPIIRPVFKLPGVASIAIILGSTSGYPIGAQITKTLLESKYLSIKQAEKLLAFCNNSSPIFILSTVSAGIFSSKSAGYVLFISHLLSSLMVGVIFSKISNKDSNTLLITNSTPNKIKPALSLPTILPMAIITSVNTILAISGFIVFFSVISALFIEKGLGALLIIFKDSEFITSFLTNEIVTSLISGFFEITSGISTINSSISLHFGTKMILTSIILGWAGISVHAQVMNIVASTKISLKPYILGKALHGFISGFITWLILKFIYQPSEMKIPAFYYKNLFVLTDWSLSALYLLKFILTMISIVLIFNIFNFLKKLSIKV